MNDGQRAGLPAARLSLAPAVPGDEEPLAFLVERGAKRVIQGITVLVPEETMQEGDDFLFPGLHVVLDHRRAVAGSAAVRTGHIIEVTAARVGIYRSDVLLLGNGSGAELFQLARFHVERPEFGTGAGRAVDDPL